MKLDLPIVDGWRGHTAPDGVRLETDGLEVLVMPLVAARPDAETWIQSVLGRDGAAPRDLRLSRLVTDEGWAAILLDGVVGDEARLVAYVVVLDYAATVLAVCRDPAARPGWRDEVLAVLRGARPDLTPDRAVCLAHLLGAPPGAPLDRAPRALAGWRRTTSGGDLVLTGDDGAGWIRISPHVTPVRPAAALFAGFGERPRITVTAEGEHVAIATRTTDAEERTLAIVFGEERLLRIEAVVTVREAAARFHAAACELAYTATLGLGAGRWRPFYYDPPRGWTGLARPTGAVWLAPACPRQYQVMRVFHARPPADHRAVHGARMFEVLPQEFFVEPPRGPVVYYTPDELECRVSVYTGRVPGRPLPVKVLEGTIVQEAYVYPIRMECDEALLESSMHVFEDVVRSVRPVPERRADIDPDVSALAFWVD